MIDAFTPEQQASLPSLEQAKRKEICAWAMYDVANSTYATVVATAVYNAYFVKTIAVQDANGGHSQGTLLLTVIICVAALMVVITAPVLGTIADATAQKKKLLLISTVCCVIATASLSLVGPGNYVPAMILLIIANFTFGTGEDFIASFLPELATKKDMGKVSAFGWGAGYVGGLFSLGGCAAYVHWAQQQGHPSSQYVPVLMVCCALFFAAFSVPTFLLLKERAIPDKSITPGDYIKVGFDRLRTTFSHARHYQDLFALLLTICIYSCGTTTVVHLASVYAQQELRFTPGESISLILVVDVTAAVGAFIFGYVQDKIGSIKTLTITLAIWTIAIFVAYSAVNKADLWIAGNIVGLSLGASGSAGRALVGQFSPPGRSGEFLGLWGVAVKLATAIGALSFGLITFLTHSTRIAMLSTETFFIVGLLLLQTVNEERGFKAAHESVAPPNS